MADEFGTGWYNRRENTETGRLSVINLIDDEYRVVTSMNTTNSLAVFLIMINHFIMCVMPLIIGATEL